MPEALTHPFPLRLTAGERTKLDRVYQILTAKRSGLLQGRTTRTDIARLALDRGLQMLLQDLAQPAVPPEQRDAGLPHDDAWMNGGAIIASDLIPPYDWGSMDPTRAGDPILVVEGRGAFVIE